MSASGHSSPRVLDPRFRVGELLFEDEFRGDLTKWSAELEAGGTVVSRDGQLEIDVPAGATLWFKSLMEGPLLIEYEALAVQKGGKNDRVSDLNCFWMARDARSPDDIFGHKRSGQFADYNPLRTYYVGLGGNANTTTRFRRYIGDVDKRPLLREHDLTGAENLLVPDRWQRIQLVASGPLIQFYRDGRRLFELHDAAPYQSGWFGFRTVSSHLLFRRFRVLRLVPNAL
ncbi:MAG: Tat pathway signal sequence domain protein [Armatimonadetes bacterium]|nr:Tat pathway signal sequence domain protein [Armatimonadota bacterium]